MSEDVHDSGDDHSDDRSDVDEEFFVGYLPTPPKTKKAALGTGALLVLLAIGVASAGAAFTRGAGPDLSTERVELQGLFVQSPYPHVRWIDEEGNLRTTLTARGHKAGLGERFAELDQQGITIGGGLYVRGGGQLLVVYQAPEASEEVAELERLRSVPTEDLGEVDLRGEVVDSKCYYGQMRPGDGRAHRACAQLCVRGGIPPVFVTRAASGEETQYLLTGAGGEPLRAEILEFLAEPTRVRGRLQRVGDLAILAMTSIERL